MKILSATTRTLVQPNKQRKKYFKTMLYKTLLNLRRLDHFQFLKVLIAILKMKAP